MVEHSPKILASHEKATTTNIKTLIKRERLIYTPELGALYKKTRK